MGVTCETMEIEARYTKEGRSMILARGIAYGALSWVVYNLAAQLYFQYLTEWSSKVWMGY